MKGRYTKMKKVLSCLLAVLILCSFAVTAFAAPSPESEGAPEVAAATDAAGNDISAVIEVVPATEKDALDEEELAEFEAAEEALDEIAASLGKNVAVSDKFFVKAAEDVSFPVNLTFALENADDFVALLHFVDGNWVLVPTETEADEVSFEADSLGAFAVLSLTK